MSVFEAVERDIAEIRKRDPRLAESGLAAMALELARGLDDPNSLTSKSLAAKALGECLVALEARAPAKRAKDGIDELNARREVKSGRRSGTSS